MLPTPNPLLLFLSSSLPPPSHPSLTLLLPHAYPASLILLSLSPSPLLTPRRVLLTFVCVDKQVAHEQRKRFLLDKERQLEVEQKEVDKVSQDEARGFEGGAPFRGRGCPRLPLLSPHSLMLVATAACGHCCL